MSEHEKQSATEGKQKPKQVTVVVNNKDVVLDEKQDTGAEIKAAAGVPAEFQLFHEQGKKLEQIGDEQLVKVHNGERFRAVSGQEVA